MNATDEALAESEWRQFRYMLFATHPTEAAELLSSVDEMREQSAKYVEEGFEEYAPVMGDEELFGDTFEYVPFSAEEVEATIALGQRFGLTFQ